MKHSICGMHRVPGPDYQICISVAILLIWSWCSECQRYLVPDGLAQKTALRETCSEVTVLPFIFWPRDDCRYYGSFEDNWWLLMHKAISIKKEWKRVIYFPVNSKLTTHLASAIQKIQIWSEFIWTMLPRESKGKTMPLYSYHRAGGGGRLFWTFTLGMKNAGSVSAWGDLSPPLPRPSQSITNSRTI